MSETVSELMNGHIGGRGGLCLRDVWKPPPHILPTIRSPSSGLCSLVLLPPSSP